MWHEMEGNARNWSGGKGGEWIPWKGIRKGTHSGLLTQVPTKTVEGIGCNDWPRLTTINAKRPDQVSGHQKWKLSIWDWSDSISLKQHSEVKCRDSWLEIKGKFQFGSHDTEPAMHEVCVIVRQWFHMNLRWTIITPATETQPLINDECLMLASEGRAKRQSNPQVRRTDANDQRQEQRNVRFASDAWMRSGLQMQSRARLQDAMVLHIK